MGIRTVTTGTDLNQCTWDYRMDLVDGRAQLRRRVLVRDELGSVTSRTFERVKGDVWAKKTFFLDSVDTSAAELVIRADQPSKSEKQTEGAALIIEVNGHTIEHHSMKENTSFQGEVDEYWSKGWEILPVPPEVLREGENTVILRDGSGKGWHLYIENGFPARHSTRSLDGGLTWTGERLGLNDFCQGEYVIRLNLQRYPPEGTITSPCIDLFALAGNGPIAPQAKVKGLALRPEIEEEEGTEVRLEWRSGRTPSYRPDTWNSWTGDKDRNPEEDHRFVQWRAILTTTEPQITPVLKKVSVEATLDVAARRSDLTVSSFERVPIVRGSYCFSYQHADERRLEILRERWRLDHVVEGAKSEFERILRLKRWTPQQWENGWDHRTLQFVPLWDAMVVLELVGRKLSLGMCTHYGSIFVQCCLALGLAARVVILTAHCVAEVWSNAYRKWVMMDPGCDPDDGRKGTRHFERYGVPMSALELHRAWAERDFQGIVQCDDPEPFGKSLAENISLYRAFCQVVRNNFLTSLYPEDREHGAVAYTYDGHLWWCSEQVPLPQFTMTTCREGDFHWTLNQTAIYLQECEKPNTLEVLLDTVTPKFKTYLVQIDGGQWEDRPERFLWTLSPGVQTLRVKSRNAFDLDGIESQVTVQVR